MKLTQTHNVRLIIFFLGLHLVNVGKSAETKDVLYYGWFFDAATAQSINDIASDYFTRSYQMEEFKLFIDAALQNTELTDPLEFYAKPMDPNTNDFDPLYHVTAKFCGGTDNCSPYSDLEIVELSTKKEFEMELIGYYFTNRTFGIRVRLSDEQKLLFENDSEADDESSSSESSNMNIFQDNPLPGVEFEDQELDLQPTSLKAHITVGCAPGIPAQVTGDDLLRIIGMEKGDIGSFNISMGEDLMVHYGAREAFVIYPKQKIKSRAIFLPYYTEPTPPNASVNKSVNSIIILSLSIFEIFVMFTNVIRN